MHFFPLAPKSFFLEENFRVLLLCFMESRKMRFIPFVSCAVYFLFIFFNLFFNSSLFPSSPSLKFICTVGKSMNYFKAFSMVPSFIHHLLNILPLQPTIFEPELLPVILSNRPIAL
ncbi:hypothetical protein QL285_082318 [Trifolium repens]|nr:hypothetical protein QL285_082318 [Trifolium repens]